MFITGWYEQLYLKLLGNLYQAREARPKQDGGIVGVNNLMYLS